MDCTPSPNKVLTENPLSALVKQEDSDEINPCSVKQESEVLSCSVSQGATVQQQEEEQVAEEEGVVKVKSEENCFPPCSS